jgi:hypothetical protein
MRKLKNMKCEIQNLKFKSEPLAPEINPVTQSFTEEMHRVTQRRYTQIFKLTRMSNAQCQTGIQNVVTHFEKTSASDIPPIDSGQAVLDIRHSSHGVCGIMQQHKIEIYVVY